MFAAARENDTVNALFIYIYNIMQYDAAMSRVRDMFFFLLFGVLSLVSNEGHHQTTS